MRILISKIILPLPILWILFLMTFILYKRSKKIFKISIIFNFLWLFIISTPFVANLLVESLENQYDVISKNTINSFKGPVHILILGGGHNDDEKLPANSQLAESSVVRLTEGIRIARLIPKNTIITSGFAGSNNTPHAIISANTAMLLGIDSSKIKIQKNPENTWQEAIIYKQTFGDSTNLILVTSAIHMPRAMYLFRKIGLNPIAAPTDFMVKKERKKDFLFWLPSARNIEKLERAIHEYVGLLWYKVVEPKQ